jgi:predicted amidohydrolase
MRVLLAQLSPHPGEVSTNLSRLRSIVEANPTDLAVFPELFLSGYRVGDRIHQMALRPGDSVSRAIGDVARQGHGAVAVGAPVEVHDRRGETENAVVVATSEGRVEFQAKRYLPTYGPFEEGSYFSPGQSSRPFQLGGAAVGFQVCYDAFFPEVSRDLALAGAELLAVISAAPVTSGRLFDKVLPARAVENACPLVYVNRVGVEDGVVFGGGSAAWDARGERVDETALTLPDARGPEERLFKVEFDLKDAVRWRPFRPVLRDVAARPAPRPGPDAARPAPSTDRPARTHDL